jgi:hypothetical protein
MSDDEVPLCEFARDKFHNFLHFLDEICGDHLLQVYASSPINPYNVSGPFILASIKELIPPLETLITSRDEEGLLPLIPSIYVPIYNQLRSNVSKVHVDKVWRYLDLWVELSH